MIPPEQVESPAALTLAIVSDPVVVGVSGADAWIEAAAGVEIVVDPSGAGALEALRLLDRHQAEREA